MARVAQADIDFIITQCNYRIDDLSDIASFNYFFGNDSGHITEIIYIRKLIKSLNASDALSDKYLEIVYMEAVNKSGYYNYPVESSTLTNNAL